MRGTRMLNERSISHGGIKPVLHDRLGVLVDGQTAIRYLRFGRQVSIDRLELGTVVVGRFIPGVPTHPAHLIISTFDSRKNSWKIVKEVAVPPDPRIQGEGLSQDMPIEQMEDFFRQVLSKPPLAVDLNGLETSVLRVECDREHPVYPSHGECNGGPYNVPFGILAPLAAYGKPLENSPGSASYSPILTRKAIKPSAPQGMRVTDRPDMLLFESDRLSIGFSLIRPIIMHLGWSAYDPSGATRNRVLASQLFGRFDLCGLSGPMIRTLTEDYPCHLWSGSVNVEANRVTYTGLKALPGVTLDAAFTVEPDRIIVELTQSSEKDVPVIEAEAWRFVWNGMAGTTGAAAVPTRQPGRNGDVELPFMWATDDVGCLLCRLIEGDPGASRVQIESWHDNACVTGGFVLGPRPEPNECQVIPAGRISAVFELSVSKLEPDTVSDVENIPKGIATRWPALFSCFRPEYRGFSNHPASTNCHVCQGPPTDMLIHTKKPDGGPDPMKLARFTIGKALLDGGGYTYFRNLYMDADPILVCAAGRIHSAEPDMHWLKSVEPGLLEAAERMLSTIGEQGLAVCQDLSGNSGSYRWSSNTMDVIGFGHIDAYVNAWTYRAMRNASALMSDLGHRSIARRCRDAAQGIRDVYAEVLVNPETGWVAGWRSRDEQLHDYAFIWVNGPAIAFGLLDDEKAGNALRGLERLRAEIGPPTAKMGLPINLLPIREEDHMLPRIFGDRMPTFERYTDGALSGVAGTYYLRALSIYGFSEQASRLADELDEGYAAGMFTGPMLTGREFRRWDGVPVGYEGTLIMCVPQLYSVAVEKGIIKPLEPEWWPVSRL